MSFKLKNHNIIFIHPPKCGGSSIAETLKQTNNIGQRLENSGAHKTIKENIDLGLTADEYFVTVRNPYDRYYSYYHFCIEWDLKRINDELPLKGATKKFYEDRRNKLIDLKFEGFVDLLTSKEKINDFTNLHKLKNAFDCQVKWFYNQTDGPVHTFKIEEGKVWIYLQELGYNIKPKHKKKSTYKTVKGYTDEQAKIVYKYFEEDFKKLEYNKGDYKRA